MPNKHVSTRIISLVLWAGIGAGLAGGLISCPSPFSEAALSTLQDLAAPQITITTPVQGSAFQSTVTVAGTILDKDNSGALRTVAASNFIASASYDILDSDPATTPITVEADGSFSFSFASATYDTQFSLTIYATDRNGNTGSSSLVLVPDADGPFLVVTSPADYGEYATVIILSGSATNSVSDTAITELLPAISYKIPGTNISGTTALDSAGSFSASIDVSTLTGSRAIEVSATDLNGNKTTAVITIVKPVVGGDISGFTVTPGNKKATISWDSVLGAISYKLFEANYGITRTGVTSPYEWTGLENGELYDFQLTAVLPAESGQNAVSASIEKIPLSDRSLAPRISTVDSRSVTLEWNTFSSITKYTLSRATSPDGPWFTLRNLTTNTFTDTNLAHDTAYFYRVTPTAYTDVTSSFVSTVAGSFKHLDDVVPIYADSGTARGVAVFGDFAYINDLDNGLVVIDISNPYEPVLRGSVQLPNDAGFDPGGLSYGITVDGNFAYVADGDAGLVIVNIANPAQPVVAGTYDTPGIAYDVAVQGNYAYVADGTAFEQPDVYGSLIIIDISNPVVPALAGASADFDASAYGVAVSGGYAFIAAALRGLIVVDISAPGNLTIADEFTSGSGSELAYGIGLFETRAYLAYGTLGLMRLDASNPAALVYASGSDNFDSSDARDVAVSGGYAYLADNTGGLLILDVSSAAGITPGTFGGIVDIDSAFAVAASGSCVFVADNRNGLAVIDVAVPAIPLVSSSASSDGTEAAIAISQDHAYLATAGTITSHGVANPDAVSTALGLAEVSTGGHFARDLVVAGDYIYAAAEYSGLAIIDISDPDTPVLVSNAELATDDDFANGIAVKGAYAYLAAAVGFPSNGALVVMDISDPAAPFMVTSVAGPVASAQGRKIAIYGDYAYVAFAGGVAKYNITDPKNPVLAADDYVSTDIQDIAVSGGYVYVAHGGNGLRVFQTSNLAGTNYTLATGTAKGVAVAGKHAYVAAADNGLKIVDISVPTTPTLLATIPTGSTSNAIDIVIHGSYAYVADTTNGLVAIKLWEDIE